MSCMQLFHIQILYRQANKYTIPILYTRTKREENVDHNFIFYNTIEKQFIAEVLEI